MTSLVVIGLGYVGLPLAAAATRAGLRVWGLEINQSIVDRLNDGQSHVDDLSDREISELLTLGFRATVDAAVIADADVVAICVPTPLSQEGGPDLAYVEKAAKAICPHLTADTLVILESTTWPGTTEEFLRPLLEQSGLLVGRDLGLAFSPERIDPGNREFHITNTPKVVGGVTASCTRRASEFYAHFVDEVVQAKGCKEAEMSKLLENTYRHVNIALVNEMLKFSNELEIDIWDVIRCAGTKPFGFQTFYPGPGVGGHCIPIDPNYLSFRVRARLGYPFRFVELAQEVNHSMPQYVVSRAIDLLNADRKAINGASVLLLGIAYKPGVRDQRESPAIAIAQKLLRLGASINFWDPLITTWPLGDGVFTRSADLREAVDAADLVIHLQPSTPYLSEVLSGASTKLLDTRGTLSGPNIVHL